MPPSAVIMSSPCFNSGRSGSGGEFGAPPRSLASGISTVLEKLRRSVSARPMNWRLCVIKFRVGARLAMTDFVRDSRRLSIMRRSLPVRPSGPVKAVASALSSAGEERSEESASSSRSGRSVCFRLSEVSRVNAGPRIKPERDSRWNTPPVPKPFNFSVSRLTA